MNAPYGGELVFRWASPGARETLAREAEGLKRVELDAEALLDAELIAGGAYSPLDGFMTSDEVESVLTLGRLPNGLLWSVPVMLTVGEQGAAGIRPGDFVALYFSGKPVGFIDVEDVFRPRGRRKHGEIALGGRILMLRAQERGEHFLQPWEVRAELERRGWKSVAGLAAMGEPQSGMHGSLKRSVLKEVDGLMIRPLISEVGDSLIASWKTLAEKHLPKGSALLSALPASAKHTGRNGVVMRAIVHRNYGCTHVVETEDSLGEAARELGVKTIRLDEGE